MGTFKLSMTILKREYRQSFFFLATLIGAVAISFMFFNLLENPFLKTNEQTSSGTSISQISIPPTTLLLILVLTFVSIMVFFTSDFFMTKKSSAFAILGMSGSHYMKTTRFLMYQLFVLLGIGISIGIGLGILATFVANRVIYDYLGIDSTIFTLMPSAFGALIAVFGTIVLVLVIVSMGYVFRNDILALLSQGRETIKRDKRALKIPSLFFVALYLYGIFAGLTAKTVNDFTGVGMIGCVGSIGIIRYFIPEYVAKLKKKSLITRKVALIALSNFVEIIERSVAVIAMTIFSLIIVGAMMFGQYQDRRAFIIILIGLFVIIALLFTSILFKVMVEVETRKHFFDNVYHIGYTKAQIIRIINLELLLYYGVIVVMPLIYLVIMAIKNVLLIGFDPAMAAITIGYFMAVGLISFLGCRHIYIKRVKTFIGRER
ncbi:MAG: hypothetical protein PHI41_03115 [Erysipelotrichaceae bacterium]|nr:hypothetical protein [Erysipelotrichaceae bacterium]MDD3810317.1 hypothetical protein [Erysipelotrichaceae bacterium]